MSTDHSAFWGAIAQILPVIALALVIETRLPRLPELATLSPSAVARLSTRRRLRRSMKSIAKSRVLLLRTFKVLTIVMWVNLALLALLMIYVEFYALVYLSGDSAWLDPGADPSRDRAYAMFAVTFGLATVVGVFLLSRLGSAAYRARPRDEHSSDASARP